MATTSGVYPCYENQFKIVPGTGEGVTIADCESFSVSFDNGIEEWYYKIVRKLTISA